MRPDLEADIRRFLEEDIGFGDLTTNSTLPDGEERGAIAAGQDLRLAGLEEARAVFELLGVATEPLAEDGENVVAGREVLKVSGPARSILSGERTALNILMRMSGIATATASVVAEVRRANPSTRVAATRKTVPGFRRFDKRAVVLGGGDPHRYRLDDGILIKDNHVTAAGGVSEAVRRAKASAPFVRKVEVEVETLEECLEAARAGADALLLDNMTPERARECVAKVRSAAPNVLIEMSGGITPSTAPLYAAAGADVISLGWLTHSAPAAHLSLHLAPRRD